MTMLGLTLVLSLGGGLYFDQGGRRQNPQAIYLRYVRFPNVLPGVDLQLGRMGYASGAEAPSGVLKMTQRPDNTGRAATRVEIDVTTVGGVVVGA